MRFGSLWIPTLALLLAACGDKAPAETTKSSSDSESASDSAGTTSGASATEADPSNPSNPSNSDPSTSSDPSNPDPTTGSNPTGGAFIVTPDGGVAGQCDPKQQDCPEGEKCVPFASSGDGWDSNKCVPVTGVGKAGDPCTWAGNVDATDDCDESSFCWNVTEVDGMEVGTCTPFCAGTADNPICDPGSQCLISNQGSVTLCIETCDPLLQDCGAGLGCFSVVNEFFCIFLGGDVPSGEPCEFLNDCAAGNVCADGATLPDCAGTSCCTAFCDLGDPACLAAGTECVAFFEPGRAPAGHEDVGVCLTIP